ncbi:hypothetical protein ACWDV4_26025 [Micromonospora sp. NPDC003197]
MNDQQRLASAVRDAVLAVPGVARLTSGGAIEVATQFSGGKVVGVRLGDPVEVHVAVDRSPIIPVTEQVRAAVQAVLDRSGEHRPVEVVVDDIDPVAFAVTVPKR